MNDAEEIAWLHAQLAALPATTFRDQLILRLYARWHDYELAVRMADRHLAFRAAENSRWETAA